MLWMHPVLDQMGVM